MLKIIFQIQVKKGEILKKPRITFQISRKNIYRYILNNKKGKKQAKIGSEDSNYCCTLQQIKVTHPKFHIFALKLL